MHAVALLLCGAVVSGTDKEADDLTVTEEDGKEAGHNLKASDTTEVNTLLCFIVFLWRFGQLLAVGYPGENATATLMGRASAVAVRAILMVPLSFCKIMKWLETRTCEKCRKKGAMDSEHFLHKIFKVNGRRRLPIDEHRVAIVVSRDR
jgi:hypothetical protein